jgi:predicted HicB family RNase H-like nuclease
MAITRKPKKTEAEQKTARPKKAVDVAALINKGGSTIQAAEKGQEKQFVQRVPEDILKRVDEAVTARRVKTSRNSWINEAILDLLEKEGY